MAYFFDKSLRLPMMSWKQESELKLLFMQHQNVQVFFHVKLEESEFGLIFLQTKIRLDNWTTKSLPSKWGCKWHENVWDW